MIDTHCRRSQIRVVLAICLTLLMIGPNAAMAKTPEPPFTVTLKDNDIEVRRYEPMIVAEVEQTGDRDTAINAGFKVLVGYIFGGNTSKTSIEMTAPVSQRASEKIAMTAPVTQQAAGGDGGPAGNGPWKVRFVMPAGSTMQSLPKPNDARVTLIEVPAHDVAAIRFSGWSTQSNLSTHRDRLAKFIADKKLTPSAPPTYAFYDPPWTLPFWRRNEVIVELAPETKTN